MRAATATEQARPQTKGWWTTNVSSTSPFAIRDDLDVVVPLDRLRRSMINYEITSWACAVR